MKRAPRADNRSADARTGLTWEPGALILLTLAAFSFGLIQMYAASAFMAEAEGLPGHFYAARQLGGGVIGFLVAFAVARIDYRVFEKLAWPLLGVTIALLVLLVVPGTDAIAPRINGARRWLRVGIAIQPSEFAKLVLIAWTAMLTVRKQDRLRSLRKGLLPFLVVWAVVVVLVMLQPNLSAAVLLLLLSALVVFAGGARIGHFIVLGIVAFPLLWAQVQSADYRLRRIAAFLDPTADPGGISYQIYQSLIAIGSGGITGVGFGGSQQKFGFLPEPHNDFLFSMIAEEWGLVGVLFTVALFALFCVIGYRIAASATDLFGYLVAIGMTNLIAVSALLHMSVALSLLPTTGVVLPFMSYGRSGLIACFIAVGVLLSVARSGHPAFRR